MKNEKFLSKSDKLALKAFLSANYPKFAKGNELANQNMEYLLGLCERCLNGEENLTFPLNISVSEENSIQNYIENNFSTPDEWSVFYLMKSVRVILEKYYDKSGKRKNGRIE